MVSEGRYSVWFKTTVGEGAGVVEVGPDGKLSGSDTVFTYSGRWEQDHARFKATFNAKRTSRGLPGVFGNMDELDIVVFGPQPDAGASISCTGFAKQAPGLKLEATLVRLLDE
jgi:hypothetical protein